MQVPLIMIGIVAVLWILIMIPYLRKHREAKQHNARLRDLAASTSVSSLPDSHESPQPAPFDARKVAVDLTRHS